MNEWLWFFITLAVAFACGMAFIRIKVPVGGIIGALAGTILFNLLTGGRAKIFPWFKVIMQLTIGAIAGSKVGMAELKELRKVVLPALIIYPVYFIMTSFFGTMVFKCSGGNLDAITSLLMACPGGASDIALIAEDLGADVAYTGVMHVLRVVLCCAVLPQFYTRVIQYYRKRQSPAQAANPAEAARETGRKATAQEESGRRMAGLLAAAAVGGLLFRKLGVTSGAIIGSVVFSMVYSCVFGRCTLPKYVRKFQQIAVGTYIGAGITMETLLGMKLLAIPAVILAIEVAVAATVLSFLVWKTRKMDLPTTLAACSPGGIAEMILLTDELGGDVSKVAVIQAFRIILAVTLFPMLLNMISNVI